MPVVAGEKRERGDYPPDDCDCQVIYSVSLSEKTERRTLLLDDDSPLILTLPRLPAYDCITRACRLRLSHDSRHTTWYHHIVIIVFAWYFGCAGLRSKRIEGSQSVRINLDMLFFTRHDICTSVMIQKVRHLPTGDCFEGMRPSSSRSSEKQYSSDGR